MGGLMAYIHLWNHCHHQITGHFHSSQRPPPPLQPSILLLILPSSPPYPANSNLLSVPTDLFVFSSNLHKWNQRYVLFASGFFMQQRDHSQSYSFVVTMIHFFFLLRSIPPYGCTFYLFTCRWTCILFAVFSCYKFICYEYTCMSFPLGLKYYLNGKMVFNINFDYLGIL